MANTESFDQTTKELFDDFAEKNGLTGYKIQKFNNVVKGENYFGIVTLVDIVGEDKENKNKTLNVVVKTASRNDAVRDQLPLEMIYTRETHLYTVVLPAFKQLEIRKGLTPTSFAPEFYSGSLKYRNETLLLENLNESCYKMHERMKPMDAKHVSFVLNKYGQLHALSLALRDQNVEQFKQITGSMDEMFVEFLRKCNFVKTIKDSFIDALNSLDENNDSTAYQIYKDAANSLDIIFDGIENATDDNSVILHGDCWTNNMMFIYDDPYETSKPTSVRFIDFQLSRVGPPVLDISYFFYTCAEKELIDNLEHYLKIYYSSLESYFIKLGSDPAKIFPYSMLKQQWKKYAKYGLMMAITVGRLILTEEKEATDFVKTVESDKHISDALTIDIANKSSYYDRVRHLMLHFLENNFL